MMKTLSAAAAALMMFGAVAAPSVKVDRAKPGNLYLPGEVIPVNLEIKAEAAGPAKVEVRVVDADGKEIYRDSKEWNAGSGKNEISLQLPGQGNGYYEAMYTATFADGSTAERKSTFGAAPQFDRTLEEVDRGDYRFGIKMYRLPNWDTTEALTATRNLGLQWTRELMQEAKPPSTVDLCTQYNMKVVFKVERFPESLFDTEKYGPLDEWIKNNGRAWTLRTLPRKADYQKFLQDELRKIPAEQNVFEIWNEAWDKMSAEDFAELSQWIAEAILAVRPDAVIGPNLTGVIGRYTYDGNYIKAGGMKHMKMIALHPYGSSERRGSIREYQAWIKEQTGTDVDIYITEFGSHSTPEGPSKMSEREQARRVTRQALYLYAEDVKALVPHWMGQREQNPRYHEHWFGFYRRNNELKPVLIAYAAAARMVDGSRYVGDLWFGPEQDAMLFEKDGVYSLALFTREKEFEIELDPQSDKVTLVDFWGRETERALARGEKLQIWVTPDIQYIQGVSPRLAELASPTVNPERYPDLKGSEFVRNKRVLKRMSAIPDFTGDMKQWLGITELYMHDVKVNGDDASGFVYLGWDPEFLYIGLDMRDNEILNTQPDNKLYSEDSMEIFISSVPRDNEPGYGPDDRQFWITPTSRSGQPVFRVVANRENGTLAEVPGARYNVVTHSQGWRAEIALPWKQLSDFKAVPGATLALEVRVNDADKSHPRWKIDPTDVGVIHVEDPSKWSLLVLE